MTTVRCTSEDLVALVNGAMDPSTLDISGDVDLVSHIAAAVDHFERIFPIVTP